MSSGRRRCGLTELVRSRDELAAARAQLTGRVGLVPTMGALHAGHAALIDAARTLCDSVVVSVFVNPMQFNQAADLERYPRPIEADVEICRTHGVDLVWKRVASLSRVGVAGGELQDHDSHIVGTGDFPCSPARAGAVET